MILSRTPEGTGETMRAPGRGRDHRLPVIRAMPGAPLSVRLPVASPW